VLKLFFWINDVSTGRMEPKSIVMLSILKKFAKYDINISYPKMDIITTEKTQNIENKPRKSSKE
jgi:small-conductance mechanosensitive channel